MKRLATSIVAAVMCLSALAQKSEDTFKGRFTNSEYEVFLEIDLYGSTIAVPNHELFGNLPGYFAKQRNNFYWLVTSAKLKGKHKAELSLINDYGSEDLKATLTAKSDSVFIMRQEEGSQLKVPNRGKWQKLPKESELRKVMR